jgi:hypothetical protein
MNIPTKSTVTLFTLIVTGIVLLTATACGQLERAPTPAYPASVTPEEGVGSVGNQPAGAIQQSAQAKVELDIFSGVPNPNWTLAPAYVFDLANRIAGLTPAKQIGQRPENLGYRGFIVLISSKKSNIVQTIRLYHGVIEVMDSKGSAYYLDPSRQIELWLLSTANPPLAENLTAQIVKEIMKDVP